MSRLPRKATRSLRASNAAGLVAAACCIRCPRIARHYPLARAHDSAPKPPSLKTSPAPADVATTAPLTRSPHRHECTTPIKSKHLPASMPEAAAAQEHPWRVQLFGGGVATHRSALVLASYPVLLLLVILAAFVRYLWIALAMYCTLLFVLSCAARAFAAPPPADDDEAARAAAVSRGGLSSGAIQAVAPAFPYELGPGEPAQCAVCIDAMKAGDVARRLPGCAHTFHLGCIDMWLDSHATCPVCRCHVMPLPRKAGKEPPEGPVVEASDEPPLPPV